MYSSERSIHFKKHAQKLLKTKEEQRKNKNKTSTMQQQTPGIKINKSSMSKVKNRAN